MLDNSFLCQQTLFAWYFDLFICTIFREEFDEEKEPDGMVLHGWTPSAAPAVENDNDAATNNGASTSSTSKSLPDDMEEDDDLIIVETGIETIPTGKKRKLSDVSNSETTDEKRAKKIPEQLEDDADVVVMLDDGNGNGNNDIS